ncbi:hypothetical protein H4582DRAFT_332520 [Lactarius indigo]|nr:hypothetical protein H4582DRAFT_332520 [Lactarius indigo]
MSQSPTPASASIPQAPVTTPSESSSTRIERIFDIALKSYKKKTKNDLKNHDLFKQLQTCNSPDAILAVFQTTQFDPSKTASDDRLKKWLVPTINVLCTLSGTLSEGISLVFPPAKLVFAGVGVLLLAAKDVIASQDILIDIFGRIESFFVRLETYAEVPLTPAMTEKMVQITVEILDILATATKEMEQSRAKKFLKKVAGWTDLEDGLKKLEKLTNDEVVMASSQVLKATHTIDHKVMAVGDVVKGVDEKVQVVESEVQVVKNELTIRRTADQVDDVKLNQLRESLRKWQSPPDPSTNHNIAGDRQHEGTAEWFLESDQFETWKLTGSLLWIHGKPGSGKSILCSAIINDVTTLCKAGSASMAYFYFDFRDIDKKVRRNLLPSLLVQLSTRSNAFCDIFSRLYEAHDNGARQPSDKALTQCLKEMLTLPDQGPIYLILDALDECPDTSDVPSAREQVLDLIKDLASLRLSNLHICVTSRPEVDICDALESLTSQTISLQDEGGQKKDIASYVRSVVYSGSGKFMRKWRKDDKEHVIETLSERADGMFRWVFCQLEVLRNCLPQNVQRVLRELPNSLDETYERMLREIGKVNPDQAYRLLQCLVVATRPLRVDELAEVLALDFDGAKDGIPPLNPDWRWDDEQQGVLSTCSSLIVVVDDARSKTRVVQFAHFSVKEFLTSDRLANLTPDISRFHIRLEPAHTVITQACFAILLQSDLSGLVKRSSPLSDYAAQHWVGHAQFENVSSVVEDGIRHLFDPTKPYFAAWLKSFNIDKSWYSFVRSEVHTLSSEADPSLCLYYAALCGFLNLTKHLIAEYPRHVNVMVGRNKSPLVAALCNRHIKVAELLHQHGSVLHIGYRSCTLLHAASKDGLTDVAQWLLSVGADADVQDDDGSTPLHFAAVNGRLEIVRILLGHGVDVSVATTRGNHTPLHEASRRGHVDVVRLLIQHGADANTDLQKLFLLASSSGSAETVLFFMKLGGDVHARDRSHKTPLHFASSSWSSNVDVVQTLIDHGADVNAWDRSHQTPLHLALESSSSSSSSLWLAWKVGVVLTLIQNGADVNARNQGQSTPLHLCLNKRPTFETPDAKCLHVLLENGADVDAVDDKGRTPYQLALSEGYGEMAQLLLDHRASIEQNRT